MKINKKKKIYKALNLPPGTMTYRGKKQSDVTVIEVINYNADTYKKSEFKSISEFLNLKNNHTISWININGLNNINEIEQLGSHYNIHPLTLEDILNTLHRPKIDEFENYLFIVFKMLYFKDEVLSYEQVSMVVGEHYVLTFQESDGDVFDDLRDRISNSKGRVRGLGSDYLMYAILDAIVDNYLTVIEAFGDKIEDLETHIFESDSNSNETPNYIQSLKQEILKIRRSIFPFKEIVNRLEKMDCAIIDPKTHSFIRDLYDHIVNVSESIDLYREMIWSLMDMHMTIISNKMNEVMKVLTIIATIFIPLTFIAGVYGMNFDNMPELQYKYGYFILLGVMIIIFIFMLMYFRRKKWL
ncbi:MAG TPA: magnesium/cobalt transporter CorA [Flavobacteriaceae bacterium]|jgi:magnesium transporter